MRVFFLSDINKMVKVVYRYLLIFFGVLSIVIGILGVLLPILPGTPFFILALACFDRSSPAFHRKLLHLPYIGERLRAWDQEKKIEKKSKKKLYLLVVTTFFISISAIVIFPVTLPAFLNAYLLQLLLIAIMLVVLFFIYKIDEK